MAIWRIQNYHKKSADEIQTWRKGEDEFQKTETFRWGIWECESDEQPVVDLNNPDGWSPDNADQEDYAWEMVEMIDGCYVDWDFIGCPDMDEEEQERIQELWNEDYYEGLEGEDWIHDETEYWLNGPLQLTNVDTGEEWHGNEV